MSNSYAGLKRRLPDVLGVMGSWWDNVPRVGRYAIYLLLIVGAFLLPSGSIGSFMTPEADWASVLFYPIGVYVLLAIGLNVVVGQAGLLDLGYVAFFAIGAYALAIFATNHGLELLGDPAGRHHHRRRGRSHPGSADAAAAR